MFLAWAKWAVVPQDLVADATAIEELVRRRKEQIEKAGQEFAAKALPLQSFRTYVNAVARVFIQCHSMQPTNDYADLTQAIPSVQPVHEAFGDTGSPAPVHNLALAACEQRAHNRGTFAGCGYGERGL